MPDKPPLDLQSQFNRLAAAAIKAGKLTWEERNTICRPGTRKAGYWGNHLINLKKVLEERGFKDPYGPSTPDHNPALSK